VAVKPAYRFTCDFCGAESVEDASLITQMGPMGPSKSAQPRIPKGWTALSVATPIYANPPEKDENGDEIPNDIEYQENSEELHACSRLCAYEVYSKAYGVGRDKELKGVQQPPEGSKNPFASLFGL
jgi:hypothetical protein